MAKTSTLYRFQIELADIDRSIYETLDLRVACHPSEDAERLVIRVLARALAHEEGLEFGRGLSHTEDPALWVRTVHGEIKTWIDVGCPSAERLHRASKASDQVRIVTHKGVAMLREAWSSKAIHGRDAIDVIRLPKTFVQELTGLLQRNMEWYVTLCEGSLSVSDGEQSFDAVLERGSLAELIAG